MSPSVFGTKDTNPSLTINDDKGFCFCHVCREGGDVIAYTRQRKGLDFVDAANLSAEILGISLETDGISPEEQENARSPAWKLWPSWTKEQETYKSNLHDSRASASARSSKTEG